MLGKVLFTAMMIVVASASTLADDGKAPTIKLDPRYAASLKALNVEAAKRTDPEANRVLGGIATSLYMATAMIEGNGRLCSGILLASNAVLTAAHCACNGVAKSVSFGDTPDENSPGARVKGKPVILGSCADPSNPPDLALLFLEKPMPASIPPRKLASSAMIDKATTGRVVGYGLTTLDDLGSTGTKMRADVPIVSTDCHGTAPGGTSDAAAYGCHSGSELVAGSQNLRIDSCNGDSGGPLYIPGPNHLTDAEDYYLAATTSRGVKFGSQCGDGGVYVRIDTPQVMKWLKDNGVTPLVVGQ